MKHTILTVAAILAAVAFSFAQTYTISPNDTFSVNGLMGDMQTLTIRQVNTTPDTIYLRWEKVSESLPPNWEASVCDNKTCYTSLLDSGTMNPVFPSEDGLLLLHITAYINYGTAIVRYAVWDINFPNTKDTLTYILNVTPTGIETQNIKTPFVWIAQNKIYLQNNGENFDAIRLIDLSGKEIFRTNISNKTEFELPPLPASIYIIQLNGKQKQYHQKIFYQQ